MRYSLAGPFVHVRDALAWRLRRALGDQRVNRMIEITAGCWRRVLTRPVYIGIAGSAGKTTTKKLLLEVLAHKKRRIGSEHNGPTDIAYTLLQMGPMHDLCIGELSEARPGDMDQEVAILRPSIGIVTVVRDDHGSNHGSRDAIATEIGKLVTSLPASGTAVLNFDDERVGAMAGNCAAKVISYGTSPTAELRAEDVSSVWPDRLQLTLVHGAQRVNLRTQLCGSQWIPSVLGAVGGGLATRMSLSECAERVARVPPFDGRMQPVTTSEGVTFIRDDFKAPLWTLDGCFEFMKAARARRKIIVIGEISDIGPKKGRKYAKAAALAQEVADIVVFVGPWAPSALATRRPGKEDALRAFSHVRDAAAYINAIAREGDLVLLKGTHTQDHLLRIILARTGEIACWRDDCNRRLFCNECPDRNKASGTPLMPQGESMPATGATKSSTDGDVLGADEQVIVGLGNPDPQRAGTPHNIGYEVVDRLAAARGLAWDTTPDAWIARGSWEEGRVRLVKFRTSMNHIGAGLKHLSESMAFDPAHCILVYDDLALPLGSVRTRLSGGAGGHNGVASILEAFQTDAFRRVKVGVGQPGGKVDRADYLLTAFDAASQSAVDVAIAAALARTVEMVAAHPKAP